MRHVITILIAVGTVACATARSTARSDRSETCTVPANATATPYVLYESQNDGAMVVVRAIGIELPERCRAIEWESRTRDRDSLGAELARRECFPAGGGPWSVRLYDVGVTDVVRAADGVHIHHHRTVGGMPSGAYDVFTWALALPPLDVPIAECTSVTDLGPYDGPMPP